MVSVKRREKQSKCSNYSTKQKLCNITDLKNICEVPDAQILLPFLHIFKNSSVSDPGYTRLHLINLENN